MDVLVKHGINRNCQCVANAKTNDILEYINTYLIHGKISAGILGPTYIVRYGQRDILKKNHH